MAPNLNPQDFPKHNLLEWLIAIPWFIFSFIIVNLIIDYLQKGGAFSRDEAGLVVDSYIFLLIPIITFVGTKLTSRFLRKNNL